MKKIININLSGRVIPIEDSAYERLQGYIESLRRYFAREEGRDEIINDIESRIAELMNDKVRKGAACVTDADVEEIISSMGRPEDFDAEESERVSPGMASSSQKTYSSTGQEYTHRRRSRLYRDADDKILGGVCSGIANYLNVDPAIIRILFAIITFGGFGLGVIAYILLWIILPAAPLDDFSGKRLFRNPSDRVLGGVASGLAAYFKKDVWVIRLIFAAPFLINIFFSVLSWPFFHEGAVIPNIVFGSITSTFVLTYIILWIVLPEARSDYERMEMRGEKVDVNSIRQNVKDRAKDFSDEVKSAAQNIGSKTKEFANTRGKEFAQEVKTVAQRTGSGIGHIIGVLFKAFFLFVAGSIAFGLFVGLMALIFGGVGLWPFKNFLLNGLSQEIFAWGTLILFLGVPLIGFITWLIRRMMRVRSTNNYLGWTFGGLWTLGWVSAALLAASLFNDFRMVEKQDTPLAITQPSNGKLTVMINEPEVRYSGSFWWFDAEGNGWDLNEDSLRMANIKIRVGLSRDDSFHATVSRYSQGSSTSDAMNRAKNIVYNASSADSILNLGSGLSIGKSDKFRVQRVLVNIEVPAGKKIRFDESVDRLHPFNVRISQRGRWNRYYNRNLDWDWDNYFDYDTNVDYVMNSNGELVNTNQPVKSKTDRNTEKKELQERLKKIEQEEKKDSILNKTEGAKSEGINEKAEMIASMTPLSLTQSFF